VKTLKYKCFTTQCPECQNSGTLQLFLNNTGKVTYARVRHHQGKGKFTYCRITNLQALKGQIGQLQTASNVDPELKVSSFKLVVAGPLGLEPRTFSLEGRQDVDLKAYREYLDEKYSRQYACLMFGYFRKYHQCFSNPNELKIPVSIRSNVLKAMVCYSKYASCYEEYKVKLKNSGIKWVTNDCAFNSFLRIVNNNHSDLGKWYSEMQNVLRDNERLFLKFALVTGLRKAEAIKSFNLIIKLYEEGKLSSYFKDGILEHFRYPELFFRKTKMVYISIVTRGLVAEIASSKPVSYFAIRKRIVTHNQSVRIRELRSYFATYLRQHGVLAEYIDLLQGRIPTSVFARHYLKVEDVKVFVKQVLSATSTIMSGLLSEIASE